MKKLMIWLSLASSTNLYCPSAPRVEGHPDANTTRVTTIEPPKNDVAIKNSEINRAETSKTSSTQTNQHATEIKKQPNEKTSTAPEKEEGGINLSTEESKSINASKEDIATIAHPETNGWFSSSKGTSIVTDNGDGTHSITTTSSKKDLSTWFITKKSSVTSDIKTGDLTPDQVLTKIQDVSKNQDARNIHTQIETALKKPVENNSELFSQDTAQKTSITSLKNKNGLTYETTNLNDGSQQIKIHNIDGSTRTVTTNIDGSIESDVMYDSTGKQIPDTNIAKNSIKKQLADGTTNETAYGEDNKPVSSHFYNKDGKLIKNINPKTAITEDISYNKDGTSIGVQRDSKGNILQNTLYDEKGAPVKAQIPGVTADGVATTHSMTYNKSGMPSSLTSYY